MIRNIAFTVFFLAVVGLIGSLLHAAKQRVEETDYGIARTIGKPVPTELHRVGKGLVSSKYAATAIAAAGVSIAISTQVEGVVTRQPVELGETVTVGQALFTLDDTLYKSSHEQAVLVSQSQHTLLNYHRKNTNEMKALLDGEYVSEEKYKAAFLNYNNAKISYAEANHKLTNAAYELEHSQVVSPISGVVSELKSYPGVYLKKGDEALVINSIDPILFKLLLPENEFQHFGLGKTVEVRLSAFQDEIVSGVIYRIDPELDEDQSAVRVYIKIPNESLKVKPGMSGTVYLEEEKHVLRIPSIAIISQMGHQGTVFKVNKSGQVELAKVTLGVFGNGFVEVVNGLVVDDQVVVAGQQNLLEGDKVRG
ncbi:MAG: efflux RND transporter periplasmic adaptor subunit [Gammaproteobacteria bacterium]|nr:efflux RND transporter periplasmic adaptor subunit [Gammaproteobacteria bacterium]